jgi:hypothetical protein
LNLQAVIPTDPSTINHVETNTKARSNTLTTINNAEPLGPIINDEQPESPAPIDDIMSNAIVPTAMPLPGLLYTEISSRSEVNELTNGSVEPQSAISSSKPSEPSKTQSLIQQSANKCTPPIPVPRARTLPRGHTSKAENLVLTSTKPSSTNPIEVLPLSVKDQSSALPATIPRLNTVGHLGLDTSHMHAIENDAVSVTANRKESVMERQRSQTLPRRPPIARRNLAERGSGGTTTELQALLAKRRQWEKNDS